MLSLSFPTAPETPPHIAHGLPSPVGSRPSSVFGRSSRHKDPGEPPHLHPGSKCVSPGAVSEEERPRPGRRYSTRNVSTKVRVSTRCAPAWTLCSRAACGLGKNRQAEGRWTGEYWATVGTLTPSIGGGGLCCHLGPQSHYCCRPRC